MSTISGSDAHSGDYDLLDRLADEFAERFRRGERPSLKEYTDRYPNLASDIRSLFPAMVDLEQADEVRQGAGPKRNEPPEPLSAPSQIGDYRLLREAGRGGMGVVYEAEQVSLGRRVALKILPHHVARDSRMLERFRREARAAARLHHTNIVPVFEVGREGETCYYAMQFILGQGLDLVYDELRRIHGRPASTPEGVDPADSREPSIPATEAAPAGHGRAVCQVIQSLMSGDFKAGAEETLSPADESATDPPSAPLLTSGVPPSSAPPSHAPGVLTAGSQLSTIETGRVRYPRSIARIGLQVAQGLAYAHARGVIHRDIKPSNLLIDTAGVVWITDFGLAKSDGDALTQSGDILGTLRYMAPERFRGEGDARADIYALGVTLYELLTLVPAYEACDRLKLIERVKSEEPLRPRLIDRRIPRDLETILLKAIDKDPKRRYSTAQEMADDLRRFLDDEPIMARRTTAVERYARWARRNPVIAVLGGALTALLVAATVASYVVARRMSVLAQDEGLAAQAARISQRQAEAAYREASAQRATAQSRATELAQTAEQLRQQDAIFRVELANREMLDNNLARAQNLLDGCPPDLRGWGWRYVMRLGNRDRQTLFGHDQSVQGAAFSPDGNWLATCAGAPFQLGGSAESTELRVWSLEGGRSRLEVKGPGGTLRALAVSPDGRRIAIGGGVIASTLRGNIWMIDSQDGHVIWKVEEPGPLALDLKFAPDGKTLAVGRGAYSSDAKGRVELRDPMTGQDRVSLDASRGGVNGVAWDPTGRHLALACAGAIEIWDVPSRKLIHRLLGHDRWVYTVAFHPDGRRLASGGWDQTIKIWDTARGVMVQSLAGHRGFVTKLTYNVDGRRLASSSEDRSVRVWDAETGREIATLLGHPAFLHALAFGPDGRTLASGSESGEVKLWNLADVEPVRLPPPASWVTGLSFRHDGRQILISSRESNQVNWVWDLESGILAETAKESVQTSDSGSSDGAFIRAGQLVRQVPYNCVVHGTGVDVLEAGSGRLISSLIGHSDHVSMLVLSPDGSLVATGSNDRTVKIWDPRTGRELTTLRGYPGGIRSLAFSPDGHRLAAGGVGAEVWVWDARPIPEEKLREVVARNRVRELFARFAIREDVMEQLRRDSQIDEPTRARSLALAADRPHQPNPYALNNLAWGLALSPNSTEEHRRRALRLARRAVEQIPDSGTLLNTLGLVLYRNGLYGEAHEILLRSLKMNANPQGQGEASDALLLAMSAYRLGKVEEANRGLERVLQRKDVFVHSESELDGFLTEARALMSPEGISSPATAR